MTAIAQNNATTTLTLSVDALKWTMPHIGKDDRRPTLQMLYLDKSGCLFATNGVTAAVAKCGYTGPHWGGMGLTANWAAIIRTVKRREFITLEAVDDGLAWIFEGHVISMVDGAMFPDWRQFFRRDDTVTPQATFSLAADKLARFAKSAELVTGRKDAALIFTQTGDGCPLIAQLPLRDDLIGLLMPCRVRGHEQSPIYPDWLTTS